MKSFMLIWQIIHEYQLPFFLRYLEYDLSRRICDAEIKKGIVQNEKTNPTKRHTKVSTLDQETAQAHASALAP